MSEDKELMLGKDGGMVPLSDLDSVLDGTEGRSDNLLDALAVYRQGKDDYFNIGEDKAASVTGIFLLSARPSRTMWHEEELTGSPPDCFSFDGITPHEVVEDPGAEKCADCPFDKMGSGKGRSKKCKTKANDFILMLPNRVDVGSDEIANVTPKNVIGPALLSFSISNRGASRSWQNWLRNVREMGCRPQGVVARWYFGKEPNKQGTEYAFVKVETVAALPQPSEAPEIWSAIVGAVQGLKAGQKDDVLLALSGSMHTDEEAAE